MAVAAAVAGDDTPGGGEERRIVVERGDVWSIYGQLIQEEGSAFNLAIVTGGIALSVLTVLITLASIPSNTAHRIPELVWMFLPVVPYAVLAQLQHVGMRSIIRSRYLGDLEKQLHMADSGVMQPRVMRMMGYATTPKPKVFSSWLSYGLTNLAALVIMATSVYATWERVESTGLRWAAVGIYGSIGVLFIIEAVRYTSTNGARSGLYGAADMAVKAEDEREATRAKERAEGEGELPQPPVS